jgi:hypothetical protein
MIEVLSIVERASKRVPWNKGKIIGAKPPLRPKHVWSIRTKLQVEGRLRDLALFNVAIDSKLRGCDVVALKVSDIAPSGYSADRASVRQRKLVGLSSSNLPSQHQAVDDYLKATGKKAGEYLFTGRRPPQLQLEHAAVRSAVVQLARQCGVRPAPVRYTFTAPNKGNADLSADGQPAGRPTFARPYQDRKHSPVSRHRGR